MVGGLCVVGLCVVFGFEVLGPADRVDVITFPVDIVVVDAPVTKKATVFDSMGKY